MRFSFRQEFIFGMVSILIVIFLIVLTIVRYNQRISQIPTTTIPPGKANTILTSEEIARHASITDCWIAIENKVYVASDYLAHHPGGASEIIPYCGKNATQAFLTKGGRGNTHSAEAFRQLGMLYIGDLNGKIIQQPDKNSINSLPVGGNGDND
jgi:cytochrome b involved in lipid metabolism